MSQTARLVECASVDCARTFPTRSRHHVHYCPRCRAKRDLASRLRYLEEQWEIPEDLVHDPEHALNKKLDEAEFSVHHDAGPQDAAFRRGARLTYQEVHYLLKYESIAVDSVLLDTQTGCRHRVIRGSQGRLKLHPPYTPPVNFWGEAKS
jgi:hypothetical protein